MAKLSFMNSKDKKKLFEILKNQFGFEDNSRLEYVFLINEKNKVYMVNEEIKDINFDSLKMNSMGLYLGELSGDEIRLSIEGTQLIGPCAKKNILEISKEMQARWIKGEELPIESFNLSGSIDLKIDNDNTYSRYIIIKCQDDYCGCGKIKKTRMMNYVPKTRRLTTVIG